jgi:AraC family transcriptional regulator of adaptative response/methylated-DNA-[protein]-cysteine methyltransferase
MRAAVARRDPAWDGRFVYGVVTTGVFCRPSCSSRAARPENLRFFADIAAATEAGYRPCRRCRPDTPGGAQAGLIELARYIQSHSDERLTLATLAERAGLSASRLQRSFKQTFGITPMAFHKAVRLGRLKASLRAGEDVTAAIFDAGFGSTSRVYESAAANIGMTPSAYRRGGEGETIAYAVRSTGLGPMLMAATARGVCAVQFGDDADALLAQLRQEFPRAQILSSPARAAPELDAWMAALQVHLDGGGPRPDLPLDLRGTAFQVRVWRFLLTVPEGEVLSYGELAERIGRPRAFRAAASACGANRIGVLVPCHRVLRGDGGLGGYRWGLERKRALLAAERARRAADPG